MRLSWTRGLLLCAAVAAVPAALAGCFSYKSETPLAVVNGQGYGGSASRPEPANIPAGPEHAVCREEMAKALGEVERLQRDLAECKRDRENDKRKFEDKKKELERDRDRTKDERDYWKDRYEKLKDTL